VAARGELQPGERVDGDRVGLDAAYVADRDVGRARLEERADPCREPRQVAPRDRRLDGELERAWRIQGHRSFDRGGRRNSSAAAAMSSRAMGRPTLRHRFATWKEPSR